MSKFFTESVDPVLREDFLRDGYIFSNYDGDTIYYHVDLGYDVWSCFLTGRLLDINAPELRPLASREEGERSKLALWAMLSKYALNRHLVTRPFGWHLRVRSLPDDNKWVEEHKVMRKGKFGRWLVVLLGADDSGKVVNLNDLMVREGFAAPYAV